MMSRERVLTALRHEQPDRTPRDFWAEPPTWKRLFAHVGHEDKDKTSGVSGLSTSQRLGDHCARTPKARWLGRRALAN